MRSVFHFVLLLTAILVPGVPAAEPPQPSPAPVLGSEDLRWLAERESFRVGVRSGQVPLVFDTGEGELAGIFIDYLNRLSEKLGVPIEPVSAPEEQLGEWLQDGTLDARLSTHLAHRSPPSNVVLSSPLMSLTYGIFVGADDAGIRTLSDLEDANIALITNDPNQFALLDPVDSFSPVPVSSISEAVGRVLSGQADAFLGPVPVVSDYLQSAMVNGVGVTFH